MRTEIATTMIPTLVGQLAGKNRTALAQLLTIAASGHASEALRTALPGDFAATPVVAFTGSGGVGKSSLLGAVIAHFAARAESIGVLACDPVSPVTGGALLGDRCRIAGSAASSYVFIRSLPTSPGQQGIAQNLDLMLALMQCYGFDHIFVETVGVGQSDIAVSRVADVVVLVVQPGTGDELQWEKAGLIELADVVVVNKGDLPGAEQTVADLVRQLHPSTGSTAKDVVKTSVARNQGIEELCRVLETVAARRRPVKSISGATGRV